MSFVARRLLLLSLQVALGFTVVPVFAQTISSFAPVSGPTGSEGSTTITITGTGFSTTAANNRVFFGAVSATPSAATATSLTVTVPAGATYQYLSVLNLETHLRATAFSQEPFIPTFYNEGAMQFSGSNDFSLFYSSSKPYFKVGDIDGDQKPDVVLLNVAANSVTVLRNTSTPGSISFATGVDITTNNTPKCIIIDDMDGDGKLDLVVGHSGDLNFTVLLNTSTSGSISFAAKVDFSTGTPYSVDEFGSCDMDGDGKPDLVTLRQNGSGSLQHFFLNTSSVGTPGFSNSGADPINGPKNVIFADFDQDGKPDFVITNASNGDGKFYRNTKSLGNNSTMAQTYSITFGTTPAWIAAGDFDGDGKPDAVSTNTGGSNIATLLNASTSGSISMNTRVGTTLGSSTNPVCVVVADLDGNGKPDIAALTRANSSVNIFRNNSTLGTITLGGRVSLSAISLPEFFAFCDFDGDGKPDMAVVNSSTFVIQKSISKPKSLFMGRFAF